MADVQDDLVSEGVNRGEPALGRKPSRLREVLLVGHHPIRLPPGPREGKRHFKSLAEVVAAHRLRRRRGGRS